MFGPMGRGMGGGMRPPQAMGMGRPQQAPMMGGQGQSPGGNAWGQQFQQQYGAPPGQMHDQWNAFRSQNGIGGGSPQGSPLPSAAGGPPSSFPGQANGGMFPGAGLLGQGGGGGMGQMPPWLMQMLQQRLAGRGGGGFGALG